MVFPPFNEPDFFTLEQICQRWSSWNCTVADLIQLCRSDKIEIGVNLSQEEAEYGSLISGYFALSPHDIKDDQNDYRVETDAVFEYSNEEGKKEPAVHLLADRGFWHSGHLVISKRERDRVEMLGRPEQATSNPPEEQISEPLRTREKNGLLSVIETLCVMANLDLSKDHKAAGVIKMEADNSKIEAPSAQTIARYLKAIADKKV